jgi:acetyl esterase
MDRLAEQGMQPVNTMTPEEARAIDKRLTASITGKSERVGKVRNLKIPGPEGSIPVRVYTPKGTGRFPLLVYFHGGGWVFSDLDAVDSVCSLLANRAACIVVSVDYRLAPEHKFPAAIEDCYAATAWVAKNGEKLNGNPNQIVVAGDSAGGGMAASVSLMARDRKGPSIAYQIFVNPAVDLSEDFSKYTDDTKSPTSTGQELLYVKGHYLSKKSDALDQRASPTLARNLKRLPPAMMITAEYDHLTKQSNAFVAKLRRAGVPVKVLHYKGTVHGFFVLPNVFDDSRNAVDSIAAELQDRFRG